MLLQVSLATPILLFCLLIIFGSVSIAGIALVTIGCMHFLQGAYNDDKSNEYYSMRTFLFLTGSVVCATLVTGGILFGVLAIVPVTQLFE